MKLYKTHDRAPKLLNTSFLSLFFFSYQTFRFPNFAKKRHLAEIGENLTQPAIHIINSCEAFLQDPNQRLNKDHQGRYF